MTRSRYPLPYQINPRVRLVEPAGELGGRPRSTISAIKLDSLKQTGFDVLGFLGTWLGPASRTVSLSNPE